MVTKVGKERLALQSQIDLGSKPSLATYHVTKHLTVPERPRLCRQRHGKLRKLENQCSSSFCLRALGITRKRDRWEDSHTPARFPCDFLQMHLLLPQLTKTMKTKVLGKLERGLPRGSKALSNQCARTGVVVRSATTSLGEALAPRVADQEKACLYLQPTLLYPRPI